MVEGLGGLVKLKKRVLFQTPRPVTGNPEVEPMETKIFSGAELEDFRGFLLLLPLKFSYFSVFFLGSLNIFIKTLQKELLFKTLKGP